VEDLKARFHDEKKMIKEVLKVLATYIYHKYTSLQTYESGNIAPNARVAIYDNNLCADTQW